MKKNSLLILISSLFVLSACTKKHSGTASASKSLKDCSFKVQVFSSYEGDDGNLVFDFEDFQEWTHEGTHDYAIAKNSDVKAASLEILKSGKVFKKVEFSLEPAGTKITHLNDNEKVVKHMRTMGEDKASASLRFVFKMKDKSSCKQDVEVLDEH